jgi:Fic-DOC domain mobile mystery protein B
MPSAPQGATPIDPAEARELIPSHIATQAELNEWELRNIVEGERWAYARRHSTLLTPGFVQRLHRKLFGNTWKWAGAWRRTEKNIGIAPELIAVRMRELLDGVAAQIEDRSHSMREIAARCHHRMVQIHPFPNGNGRLARTYTDLLLAHHDEARFTWGDGDLIAAGDARERYIAALRSADARDYGPLMEFLGVKT